MTERLTDEEFDLVDHYNAEGEYDSDDLLVVLEYAVRMVAELRARRAADLSTDEMEALRFARKVVGSSEGIFSDRTKDPAIAAHMERCRAAASVLDRLFSTETP